MITTVKDDSDKVIAYAEWRQVGQSGFDVLKGNYIWINDFWLHDEYKNDWSIIRQLIYEVLRKAKDANWVYWKRAKYDERQSRYSREKIMNLLDRGAVYGWR